jgi:predicted O-methyltransferase YrrM
MKALAVFFAKYFVGLAGCAFLFLGGILRGRHRVLLNAICAHFGFAPKRVRPDLPIVEISAFVPADIRINLQEARARDGNVSLLELMVIAQLTAARQPAEIFEIGTFDGRTTLNLAANSAGRVFTLDLPAEDLANTGLPLARGDASYVNKPTSGARFAGKPEATRITQLVGDSANFDFSPWHGRIELVFIDGAHSREYVLSDTERALRLLRPGRGVILWHDYDAHFDGVTEALHGLAHRGLRIQHIAGTSFAIHLADA